MNKNELINTYLQDEFLKELEEFMTIYGSQFHNGIDDEEAIKAFIAWRKNQAD